MTADDIKLLSERELLMAFENLRNGWQDFTDAEVELLRAEWHGRKQPNQDNGSTRT